MRYTECLPKKPLKLTTCSLSHKLLYRKKHTVQLPAMRAQARRRFLEKYTAEENLRALLAIYRTALDMRHSSAPSDRGATEAALESTDATCVPSERVLKEAANSSGPNEGGFPYLPGGPAALRSIENDVL